MHKSVLVFLLISSTLFAQTVEPMKPTDAPPPSQPVQASAAVKPAVMAVKRTPEGNLILEESTPVRLRTKRNLSSADCKNGDQIDFEVLDPVILDGITVISQDGIAFGVVTEAVHKKTMGRAGKLDISIQSVKMTNGDKANLRAVKENKGGGHVGAMTGAMVATSIVFFPAAPLFLFMHGKDINIPAGTEFTAYVNGDTVFASPSQPFASQPTTNATMTELVLTSLPDGADVEVDGAFVGSAPATLQLPVGDHTIRVSRKGFAAYEKKVHTAGGKVSLRIELEPAATPVPAKAFR
jgi:hypothetical protein